VNTSSNVDQIECSMAKKCLSRKGRNTARPNVDQTFDQTLVVNYVKKGGLQADQDAVQTLDQTLMPGRRGKKCWNVMIKIKPKAINQSIMCDARREE